MEKSRAGRSSPLKKLKLPARATAYYGLSAALAKSVGILTTPIFTRILDGEEYGKYTLYMSLLGLFSIICSSFLSPTVIYRAMERFSDKRRELIFSAFCFGIGATSVFCLLLFAFNRILGLEFILVPILCLQLLCDVSVGFCQTLRRYEYKYKALSLINALSVVLTPLLSVSLILGGGLGYLGRIYSLLFVSLIIALPHVIRLFGLKRESFDRKIIKYIAGRSFPLLPHSASGAFSAELDKLMITALLGAEALAKYSVAHTLGLGLGFAVTTLASALYPWVVRRLSSNSAEEVAPTFSALISGLGAVAIGLGIVVPELFGFLAPREYFDAQGATLPLLLSTLPTFASSFITVGIVNAEKGSYTLFSALSTVFSGILFNILLIPRLKYLGAALSLLISSLIGLAINCALLKKCGAESIFPPKDFSRVFSLTLLGLFFSAMTYNTPAFRILLLILPVSMLYKSYGILRTKIKEG